MRTGRAASDKAYARCPTCAPVIGRGCDTTASADASRRAPAASCSSAVWYPRATLRASAGRRDRAPDRLPGLRVRTGQAWPWTADSDPDFAEKTCSVDRRRRHCNILFRRGIRPDLIRPTSPVEGRFGCLARQAEGRIRWPPCCGYRLLPKPWQLP
jgi:hypothetical protein